ncbi:MAG TPA: carboxypeptidase regulatory-like domain-containing protein [Acidobacteriaceae bacterium]|nr:carboxypeptidase regulatory-like domain-containing protein [Acidobacteriaceae bacterium]
MSRFLRSLMLIIAVAISGLAAHGQLSTATMFGIVTDTTGAAVPGATVVITQTDTQTTRTLKTESDGSYRADFLPVGPYKLSVSAQGFKTLERTGITLTVTEEAHVDLQLPVGGESTTVEVTAEVPLLNTGNSTLGRTVSNVEIDNLPLVDRNVYTLLDLTPGVQNNNNSGIGGNGGVINPLGYPEQHVKINGSSDSGVGQVSYYLDGGSNMTGVRNTGNPLPNPDAIREFRVDTNNFSAQYGRNSAGVVTVLTKSGTNDFHGSVFEFYRDRNFNATTRATAVKTPYNQHRFGFTVGGPVKRDKLFFFGSYAGFRFITDNIFNPIVPSAAMVQGNFTANIPTAASSQVANNVKCTIAAQSSTQFWACNPYLPKASAWCDFNNQPNVCDPSTFDPSIMAIMKANLIPTAGSSGTINQLSPYSQKTDEQLYKGDYQMTAKQRLTFSYFHETGDFIVNPSGNNVLGWVVHNYNFAQHEANIQHVWTISNSTVNQLALNYTRLIGGRVPSPSESLANYGSTFAEQIPNGTICGVPAALGCSRPQLGVSGWFTAGNAISGPVTGTNLYAIRDVVSSTHGKHTLYYGGEADRENDAQQTSLNDYGVFSFTAHTNTTNHSSAAITDFLFGSPNSMEQDVPVYANANYFNYGLFLQDDWRAFSNLTLNLGVRYDIQTTPTDTLRRTMNFVPGAQSTVAPNGPKGVLFPGDPGVPAGGVNTRYNHISPRVGLAWTPYPNGHTVIHAAAGLFYGSVGGNLFTYPSNGEPFSGRPTFNNVIHVSNPYATDPKDFCNGDPTCIAGGVGHSPYPFIYNPKNPQYVVTPAAIIPVDPNFRWPVSYQVNFGFQQQLGGGFAFSGSYVGAFSRKLPTEWDANYPQFNVTSSGAAAASCTDTTQACAYADTSSTANNRRPYNAKAYAATSTASASNPIFSTISQIQSSESANYNSLQVTIQKRLAAGFSAQGFYVWSKALQSLDLDTSGNTGNSTGTEPEDNHNHWLDRQRSDYDQRHVVAASIVWKPHYNFNHRAERLIVNDWTFTSIIRIQSGVPFNITTGSDNNGDGVTNDRPNLVPGLTRASVTDNGHSRVAMIHNWVSPSQFCVFNTALNGINACPQDGAGPAGSDGTVRQNSLDAPGRRDIDASIFRDFPIWERVTFQIRGEATNVFNLTNLPPPNGTLNSSTFGQITTSYPGGSFGNRVIQVGGRILF